MVGSIGKQGSRRKSVRRYSHRLTDYFEFGELYAPFRRLSYMSNQLCFNSNMKRIQRSSHISQAGFPPEQKSYMLEYYDKQDNRNKQMTESGIVLNLDNTRLGDPYSQTIINAYHRPGVNIFDHYDFIGDCVFSNVFTKFVEFSEANFGRKVIDQLCSNDRFFIRLRKPHITDDREDLVIIVQNDDSNNADTNARAKDFSHYQIFVFGTFIETIKFRNFIQTITFNKNASYFSVESYHYHRNNDDVLFNTIHIGKKKYDNIIDNIHPRVNIPQLITSYLGSSENILILFGEPGTGKTTLIKQIMLEYAKNSKHNPSIIYTKDTDVLRKDMFWNMILEREPDILILDDFDKELENRENDKHDENSIVNKILSVSDGLFHSRTKIVITTNMKHTDIDPAIIRPGRCFDIIQIPALSRDEALDIWLNTLNQNSEDFEESFHDMDVIKQAYLMSEYDKYRFANKNYLSDATISVRNSYVGRKKSFGFAP